MKKSNIEVKITDVKEINLLAKPFITKEYTYTSKDNKNAIIKKFIDINQKPYFHYLLAISYTANKTDSSKITAPSLFKIVHKCNELAIDAVNDSLVSRNYSRAPYSPEPISKKMISILLKEGEANND